MKSSYYHAKAARCRELAAIALNPEIKEQLRLWELEFDDLADQLERRKRRQLRAGWDRLRLALGAATRLRQRNI